MTQPKKPEFHPTQRLQREYEQGMRKILGRVLAPKRQDETFDQWVARLAERSREPDIQSASQFLARKMVQHVNTSNARTWREAAAKSGRGRHLYALLIREVSAESPTGSRITNLVRENAQLISSIPLVAAQKLTEEIARAQQEGARASTVAKMLSTRFPKLLRSRVHLISRTETAKASLALTESRCEELNIQWYEWLTSEDQRVRLSHRKMAGVIVPWSQPPDPDALAGEKPSGHTHAGGTYNCRCSQAPILTLDDIRFPARVYWQGRISQMTKQQFRTIAVGLESRAA